MTTIEALLARCTFPQPGTPVACAVSGGADSSALLVLAVHAGLSVTAVHIDHGLRPTSSSEAAIVAGTAARFGAMFQSHVVDVAAGPNQEARARAARYNALPSAVMTGHTADDQAETMLINLLRGAGAAGLAAMRPGMDRPILALRRSDTEQLCTELDITVVHDESNSDSRFVRNRVRHELLPLMNTISQRDLVPILTRQADLWRDDHDYLAGLAESVDPTDAKALSASPLPLARRVVRRWLTDQHPPDAASVERVLAVARGEVEACEIAGGRRVQRTQQRLRLVGPIIRQQNS